MLKILQTRLQQYVNREILDIQAGFRKGRGTGDQIANIRWIIEKARKFQKASISTSLTMVKPVIVWTTIKGFGIVNKTEIDVFLELSYFFHDPADFGNLISGSSAFFNTSVNICKLMVHVLLKLGLQNFEHYFTSM